MKSCDTFRQWALIFLNESDYQRLIVPIIEKRQLIPIDELKILYQNLDKAPEPPKELLDPNYTNSFQSIFELFLKQIYNKSMPIKLFTKLINFIPSERKSDFFCLFLNSLDFFDFIRIIPHLPQNNSVKHMGYCKLLLNDKTFLSAFSFLIQNFEILSSEMKKHFNYCFRKSLSTKICKNSLIEMVHIAFEFAPQIPMNENTLESLILNQKENKALDMFFSALTDDISILTTLCQLKNINNLFEDCTIRFDLPQSFLRFLLFTSLTFNFKTEHLFSFIYFSPTYFFDYVNHLDDSYNEAMWIQILSLAISFELSPKFYEFHKNIFLALLLSILKRPNLMQIFKKNISFISEQFQYFIKAKVSTILRNQSLLALFILFLSFARINETIASVIIEPNLESDRAFRKTYSNLDLITDNPTEDDLQQALVANSYANLKKEMNLRSLLNLLIDSNEEIVENSLLWLFSPKQPFPIDGIMKLDSEQNFSNFPYPSYTFITEIAPLILRPMIESKNEKTISKILDLIKIPDNVVLFKEISSPTLLHPFLEKSLENPLYYKLITTGLSISCDFTIFSHIFQSICTDIEKTIDFLTTLSSQSLLVDDYLYINDEYILTNPVMSGTICMWIRTHSKNAKIFSIISSEIKIDIYHELNDFFIYIKYLDKEKEKEIIQKDKNHQFNYKILNVKSINGWYFLSFSLEPKSGNFSVNLQSTSFKIHAGNKATMSIGSSTGIFDLQLLKIQRPSISQGQINYLFALGPNYKESIIPDFYSIQCQQPLFVSDNSYVSKIYLKWADIFNDMCRLTKSTSESFKSFEELSISPPFRKKSTSRKSAYSILKVGGFFESILEHRLSFTPFINSFDAHGGIPFLIHIWGEVLLNKISIKNDQNQTKTEIDQDQIKSEIKQVKFEGDKDKVESENNFELMKKMFDLINLLLNKFPLFHYYFERNSIYCLIGHLMKQTPFDAIPLAICRDNNLITNINIIKYWVLGPILEKQEFPNAIKTLIDISSNPQNQQLLNQANCFVIIIRHISSDSSHTPQFLKLLSNLAMSLTTDETYIENATFLFNVLIVEHLQFSEQNRKESEKQNDSSVVLVRLMYMMLESYPNLNSKLNLELLIPAVIPTTNYQADLIDLLINYIDESMLYIFSVVLMSIPSIPDLAERLYKQTSNRLSTDKRIITEKVHILTLPLVYFASHLVSSNQEDFFALCAAASFILDSFTVPYPLFVYEEMLQIICSIETQNNNNNFENNEINNNNNNNNFILPQTITKEFFKQSTIMPPFVSLLTTILPRALVNNDKKNVEKFFISIFTIQKLPIYRQKGISLFLIGKLFEKLIDIYNSITDTNSNSFNNLTNLIKDGQIESFLKFCLSFGSFAFQKIQMIPGDKTEYLSLICCFFLKEVFLFGEILDSSDVFNAEIGTLVDFSSLNSISSLVVDNIVGLKKLSKHKKYSKTIDRLRNPTGYPPVKISHQKFEKKLDELTQKFQNQDGMNRSGLLTIICNSIQYRTASAGEINFVDENDEKIIETWHEIFNTLHFPSSRIFEGCPNKYTVNDKTTCFERRRTLLPINPSSDSLYTSFYSEKYQNDLPKIRLTLTEVLENTSLSHYHSNDVSFSGDVVRLTGISLLKGILVILPDQIKFYQKMNRDVITFKFKEINYIKLMDYMHQPRGILVENTKDDIYLFAFEAQSIRDCFIEMCENIKKFAIIKEIEKFNLEEVTNQWRDGLISNFDYLLKLNAMSGRTWADFTQFPVFPWTLKDFESPLININDPAFYRDLEFPLFAESKLQKNAVEQYYETVAEIGSPHHFPKYISNVGSTLYFLVRLEPFTDAEIDFQGGKLDYADRTFHSFKISYDLMTVPGSKSALELVPEVYFFPEMLENINGVSFGVATMTSSNSVANISKSSSANIENKENTTTTTTNNDTQNKVNTINNNNDTQKNIHNNTEIKENTNNNTNDSQNKENIVNSNDIENKENTSNTNDDIQNKETTNNSNDKENNRKDENKDDDDEIEGEDVSNVILPNWCKSPDEFVDIMRDALESNVVSQTLNEWIDLIWGFRRQGKGSIERLNVLSDIVYDFNPEEYIDDYSMMKAMSETIHNCGQAPAQLFESPHPKKRVFTSMKEVTVVQNTKVLDENPINPKLFSAESSGHQIVISSNSDSIVIYRNSIVGVSYPFSSELRPISIAIDQNYLGIGGPTNNQVNSGNSVIIPSTKIKKKMFVTAHQLPIINHWVLTKKGLKHLATVRGRLTQISCLLLDSSMAIILAGHFDGFISVFSTNPHVFIREIKCRSMAPIFMMKLIKTKGNLICFQRDENDLFTIVTMWSINGQLLGEIKIPFIIIDCVVSSFAEGTVKNIIVFLTNCDELLVIKERSFKDAADDPLRFMEKISIGSRGHTSLKIWKNTIIATIKGKPHTAFSLESKT